MNFSGLGNFFMNCCCLLTFFKINFFQKILSGILSVKQFGPKIRTDVQPV